MAENPKEDYESELLEDIREELKEPDMWKVVLLNDDYTPRDFVVEILVSIFHKQPIEATKIMLDVHNKGRGDGWYLPIRYRPHESGTCNPACT